MVSTTMERRLWMFSRLGASSFDKLMVAEAYLRYCQISMMEHVAKIVKGL